MRVYGVTYPGIPTVAMGCNDRLCWGMTFAPVDQTDNYQEQVVFDAATHLPKGTIFDGKLEPVTLIPQSFRVNHPAPGTSDNITSAVVGPLAGGVTVISHRHGPIVALDATATQPSGAAISVQSVTLYPTRELEGNIAMARARDVGEFEQAVHMVSFSYNYGVADVEGNIAYFNAGVAPLREDLQMLGRVDGNPPFLLRDGTHQFKNEWLPLRQPQPFQSLPFEILPYSEMPHAVNPAQGFLANTNNDPVGVTLHNRPLGHVRPNGGIYYLDWSYADGNRQGQILRLIQKAIASGEKISPENMMNMQANNQLFDASIFVPYIVAAFNRATSGGSPAELAGFAQDPGIAEAIARFRNWDFSTPTGIAQGYDPGSYPGQAGKPSMLDVDNSVAATIYNTWRGQFIQNTIDATLIRLGILINQPGSSKGNEGPVPGLNPLPAVRHLLDNFQQAGGIGSSGANFFLVPGAPSAGVARDVLILRSLRGALDLLASDAFAPAFANSKNQQDYRWGRLHREVLAHPLGGPFDIPSSNTSTESAFVNLAPDLPGLAKAGGRETLDLGESFMIRPQGSNDLMFITAPSRRLVAEMEPGNIQASEIIPGGESGDPRSPFYSSMLGRYLTDSYHPLQIDPDEVTSVEEFTP